MRLRILRSSDNSNGVIFTRRQWALTRMRVPKTSFRQLGSEKKPGMIWAWLFYDDVEYGDK
jgi:hypothetical protein